MIKTYQLHNAVLRIETNDCLYAGPFIEIYVFVDCKKRSVMLRKEMIDQFGLEEPVNENVHMYDVLDDEVTAALYYHSIVERSEITSARLTLV